MFFYCFSLFPPYYIINFVFFLDHRSSSTRSWQLSRLWDYFYNFLVVSYKCSSKIILLFRFHILKGVRKTSTIAAIVDVILQW